VTPSRSKWLVASAKVQGGTFAPEMPKLYDTFLEVIDERPQPAAIVVYAPIGYRDTRADGPRICDAEARALLGRRQNLLHNAPTHEILNRGYAVPEDLMDIITMQRMRHYIEVYREMKPYRQRQVYEGNPELSFYTMNEQQPLEVSKKTDEGRIERELLLRKKIPYIERVLDAELPGVAKRNLIDAAAMLATARQVFTKSAKRLPSDGVWDSEGLRMEIVY
jgi:predicted RNase H-like nuclease